MARLGRGSPIPLRACVGWPRVPGAVPDAPAVGIVSLCSWISLVAGTPSAWWPARLSFPRSWLSRRR